MSVWSLDRSTTALILGCVRLRTISISPLSSTCICLISHALYTADLFARSSGVKWAEIFIGPLSRLTDSTMCLRCYLLHVSIISLFSSHGGGLTRVYVSHIHGVFLINFFMLCFQLSFEDFHPHLPGLTW